MLSHRPSVSERPCTPLPDGAAVGREAGGLGGFGRITLTEFCVQQGLDLDQAVSALKERGVEANGASKMGVIARSIGVKPRDVIEIVRKSR